MLFANVHKGQVQVNGFQDAPHASPLFADFHEYQLREWIQHAVSGPNGGEAKSSSLTRMVNPSNRELSSVPKTQLGLSSSQGSFSSALDGSFSASSSSSSSKSLSAPEQQLNDPGVTWITKDKTHHSLHTPMDTIWQSRSTLLKPNRWGSQKERDLLDLLTHQYEFLGSRDKKRVMEMQWGLIGTKNKWRVPESAPEAGSGLNKEKAWTRRADKKAQGLWTSTNEKEFSDVMLHHYSDLSHEDKKRGIFNSRSREQRVGECNTYDAHFTCDPRP